MKKIVYFVRHGEKQDSPSHNSILNKNLTLTKTGILQAEVAGQYLASVGIFHVYSSHYKRAEQTAEIISKLTETTVSIDSRLGERVLFTRDVSSDLAKKEFIKSQNDWDYKTNGGESLNESVARFSIGVNNIIRSSNLSAIAIVTHGRILQSYLKQMFIDNKFGERDLIINFCDIYKVEYENDIPISYDFVFSPLSDELDLTNKITTLAQTLVIKSSDNKIFKTHLFSGCAHDIQSNIYEKKSLDLIAECGLPIPKGVELINMGKWLTMNFTSDKNLGDLLSNSVDVRTNLKEIGKLIRKFHDTCSKGMINDNKINIKQSNQLLNSQCALNFKELTLSNRTKPPQKEQLNYSLFKAGVKLANKTLLLNPQYLENVDLIYGDLKPDNILIEDKKIFFIDPLLSYGRKSCDLGKMVARLYLTNFELAEDNINALFDGYQVDSLMKKEIYDMAAFDILNTYSRALAKGYLSRSIKIPSHKKTILNMGKSLKLVNDLLSRKYNILILRHLEDIQDFRVHYRNTPIIPSEKEKALGIAELINDFAKKSNKTKVCFISSEQLRAIETAKLIDDKLSQLDSNLYTNLDIDNRIRDLYHGEYTIPDNYQIGQKLPALTISTKCYIDQTFNKRNIDYRNGDTYDNTYPNLKGLFRSFGETQRSFSVRFYSFMADFLSKIEAEPNTLFIIVAHTAIAFRLFELSLIENYSQIKLGDLTFEEWSQVSHLDRDPGNQLFISPGEVKKLNLADIIDQRDRFMKEVFFLKH